MEKLELKVLGMNCPHCENRVVTKLNSINGVKACEASHKKKRVIVEFDSLLVSKEIIVAEIENAGYQVK